MFVLNLSRSLYIIKIIIKDGKRTADVAIKEPKSPEVTKPAKVATFTPTGPGVTEETAIISVNC